MKVAVLVSTTTPTPSSGATSSDDAKPGTLPSWPTVRCSPTRSSQKARPIPGNPGCTANCGDIISRSVSAPRTAGAVAPMVSSHSAYRDMSAGDDITEPGPRKVSS